MMLFRRLKWLTAHFTLQSDFWVRKVALRLHIRLGDGRSVLLVPELRRDVQYLERQSSVPYYNSYRLKYPRMRFLSFIATSMQSIGLKFFLFLVSHRFLCLAVPTPLLCISSLKSRYYLIVVQ